MVGREDILNRSERLRLGNERRLIRVDAVLAGVPVCRRRLLFSPTSQYVFISPLPCNIAMHSEKFLMLHFFINAA